MSNIKVMIIDDDPRITELISLYLNKENYDTKEVHDGKNVLIALDQFKPDLVLLDLMLPEFDGYYICKEIRKLSTVPIIIVTAKGETFDKVLGLELGADDYIIKPFDPKELIARIKAVLRRFENGAKPDLSEIVLPNLIINYKNYSVKYHQKNLELPPKEFELLYFLATHQNQVFTRDQLLDTIWNYDFVGDSRTIDVHIKRLREKMIYEDEWCIKTVWGVGYKFEYK